MSRGSLLAAAIVLAACGGGGGGSSTPNPPNPPATNSPPTANAGGDQTVLAGATVTLSGSGADTDGSVADYSWTQIEGAAVTLAGANTATATFTAPAAAANLTFRLQVTDNGGATHADTVAVIVSAPPPPPVDAPTIVRQPTNPSTVEHGSALIFAVASGEDLNYEWHATAFGNNVIKSGPEPFLLLENRSLADDGHCYHVVVSNSAGTVTSEPACIAVAPLGTFDLDPTDEAYDDEDHVSLAYGNALFDITQRIVGVLTGSTLFGATGLSQTMAGTHPEGIPCGYSGRYLGATLDGQAITQPSALPLGLHTISMIWEGECRPTSDHTIPTMGGVLVTYDFPETFGVGSATWHLSGNSRATTTGVSSGWMNGIFTATFATAFDLDGHRVDDIDITVLDGFSVAAMRKSGSQSNEIHVTRRFNADGSLIERSIVDFDVGLNFYDVEGFEGVVSEAGDTNIELNHDPDEGGISPDDFEIGIGPEDIGAPSFKLSTLLPLFGAPNIQWSFEVAPRDDCPDGQICVDPPDGP